jgi:hypothetical protein
MRGQDLTRRNLVKPDRSAATTQTDRDQNTVVDQRSTLMPRRVMNLSMAGELRSGDVELPVFAFQLVPGSIQQPTSSFVGMDPDPFHHPRAVLLSKSGGAGRDREGGLETDRVEEDPVGSEVVYVEGCEVVAGLPAELLSEDRYRVAQARSRCGDQD